ncbi:MAG: ribonuclease HII [Bacteroidales bacterium]
MKSSFAAGIVEAGCDEAGRGCLAGPVFAAAVILPPGFTDPDLRDSKKCSERLRLVLRERILSTSLAWGVASVDNTEIDRINILQASILAMHRALDQLKKKPGLILVDGNRFKAWKKVPHQCIIKGDDLYFSIAAASILAKTARDAYMKELHEQFPHYGWERNKGYPTREHRRAIFENGITPFHRRSFTMAGQLSLELE